MTKEKRNIKVKELLPKYLVAFTSPIYIAKNIKAYADMAAFFSKEDLLQFLNVDDNYEDIIKIMEIKYIKDIKFELQIVIVDED